MVVYCYFCGLIYICALLCYVCHVVLQFYIYIYVKKIDFSIVLIEPYYMILTRRRLARERKRCFSSSSEDGSRKR
jgi:hypothetical protein